MEKKSYNDLLMLGIGILLIGILLMTYSISTYKETKTLSEKIDFEELDNNNQMSSSDKYFKYLSIADYLNQNLNKNKNLPIKNSSCIYLDYAQHNALSLYKLTYNGLQTEEARKSVAAGNIRGLYNILDNYRTCKQTEGYKNELSNILSDIQKSDDLYSKRESRMEAFMKDYNNNPQEQETIPQDAQNTEEQVYSDIPQEEQYTQNIPQESYPQQQPLTNN